MTDQDAEPAEEFHRDRREHGGAPAHPDDDRLARLTEEERVDIIFVKNGPNFFDEKVKGCLYVRNLVVG